MSTVLSEPIYVGSQRRSHPPYFTGTRKSFVPGPVSEVLEAFLPIFYISTGIIN